MKALRFALTLLVLLPAAAAATVGGATLCEMLGYDGAERRVYLFEHDFGGGDEFGRVLFFDLEGADAGRLRGVPWNRRGEGTAADRVLRARLDSLRAALAPLRPAVWPTLPLHAEVAARDSVPNGWGQASRLRVRAVFGGGPDFEVTAWRSAVVTRPAVYEIPGRTEWVWVLAFVGDPFETGYETQVPVLVRPGERGLRRIEWRRAGE